MTDSKIAMLLLDHDLGAVKHLGGLLQARGYEVLFAPNAQQAQKIIAAKSPDHILLNGALPDLGAFTQFYAAEQLSTPVLLMGSFSQRSRLAAIESASALDLVQQSPTEEELLFRLQRQFELVQYRRFKAITDGVLDTELNALREGLHQLQKDPRCLANPAVQAGHMATELDQLLADLSVYRNMPFQHPDLHEGRVPSVLVVEDCPLNQDYAASVLAEAGYNVVLASSAGEALAQVKQLRPQLLILDMTLPDGSGPVLYQQIRELDASVPVIALSGYSRSEKLAGFPDIDFDDYLVKPTEAQTLLSSVEKVLGEARLPPGRQSLSNRLPNYSAAEMAEWLGEFRALARSLKNEIRAYQAGNSTRLNRETLHGMLNYSVYFGTNKLRHLVRGLLEQGERPELLQACRQELAGLLAYYQNPGSGRR